MSVSYASHHLSVPAGFEYLLESLAREVLREQPKDIIAFAAEYFKARLMARDEGIVDTPLHKVSTAPQPAQDDSSITSEPQPSTKEQDGMAEDGGTQSENEVIESASEGVAPSDGGQVSQDETEPTELAPPLAESAPLSVEESGDGNDSSPDDPVNTSQNNVLPSDQEGVTETEDENVEGGVSQDESEKVTLPDDSKGAGESDQEPVTTSEEEGENNGPTADDQVPAESGDVESANAGEDRTDQEGSGEPSETERQEGVKAETVLSSTSVEGTPAPGNTTLASDTEPASGDPDLAPGDAEPAPDTDPAPGDTKPALDTESAPADTEPTPDTEPAPSDPEPESMAEGGDSALDEEKPLSDKPANEDTDIPTDDDQTS